MITLFYTNTEVKNNIKTIIIIILAVVCFVKWLLKKEDSE
jgi:hypothetical protein